MIRAGIVLMRNLPRISVVVAAWLSTCDVATAFPDDGRTTTSPRLGMLEDQGLKIRATGVFGDTTSSGRSPSPVVRGRPKLFLRVVDVPVLSVGDRALLKRPACPNRDLPRFDCSFSWLCRVRRCVLLCRFLL